MISGDESFGERDEIFEPQGLEPDRRAEGLQLLLDRIRQEVVAGDDGDGDFEEMGLGADHAQKLQPVGDRHAHVEDDRARPDVLGELQARLGINGRGDLETLELEHPREGIGDRSIVVYDEDCFRLRFGEGALGRSNHRIILKPKEIGVKLSC